LKYIYEYSKNENFMSSTTGVFHFRGQYYSQVERENDMWGLASAAVKNRMRSKISDLIYF
jgi:hypothetical protein